MSATTAMLRVDAFLPYPTGRVPGQRYRIEQWAPYLKREGIEVRFSSFLEPATMNILYEPGHHWRKLAGTIDGYRRTLTAARRSACDVAYVYREAALLGGSWIERRIARSAPCVFDFDDAIYLQDVSPANRTFGWLKSPRKTGRLCELSSVVVVGNAHLAEYARRHNPQVTIVPSSIDLEVYRVPPRRSQRGSRAVIGWMGSTTSQRYLEEFAPVLRRIAASRPIEIRVISDRAPVLPGLPIAWRRWSGEREAAEIAEFDVGIMPLPDTPWTRGKCAMKALQYMAMGVPTICSPVGANREVVRHGENGLLADSADEWLGAVSRLLDDEALCVRLGRAGRLTVERDYSAAVCAARFARVLRAVVPERTPQTSADTESARNYADCR